MTTGGNNAKAKPARLTDVQAGMLDYISDEIAADILDRSPKLRTIAQRFGIGTSSVWSHVENLKRRKCLEGESDAHRSLRLTKVGAATVAAWKGRKKRAAGRNRGSTKAQPNRNIAPGAPKGG